MTSPGKEKGIKITAYSPLGNNITGKPRIIDSPEVKEIAKRLGKEPAQVLIAWGAKQGFFVIPKSVTESRIKVSRRDEATSVYPRLSDTSYHRLIRPASSGPC
jgi:diketogulonate reductase-like aldo/keto reductase